MHIFVRPLKTLTSCAAVLILAGCGGGGSSSALAPAAAVQAPQPAPSTFTPGEFAAASNFAGQCENPRPGDSRDSSGATVDENNFLRSWSNNTYLWYDEITDRDPALSATTAAYFELMRTNETTASGAPKDKFHFSLDTEEWEALSQSGVSAGYGVEFAILSGTPPREIVVAYTEPNTPATAADVNLVRGARILEVDGRDAVNGGSQADVDALNGALFPSDSGESHTFLIREPDGVTERTVTMVAGEITSDPVQNVRIEDTANGMVGYLTFNSHIRTAQQQLFDAMTEFETAGISELVLDLRYNGGGFLVLANELAAMVAGPAAASGRVFEEIQFNDKHPTVNPVTGQQLTPDVFRTTQINLDTGRDGPELPTLNLSRVFVLSGPGTCSASESIINGLRGIGIEVVLIGGTTCGKPYGFYATDNCGTSYFTVQFRGVNDVDFGDYSDGFSPANLQQAAGVSVPGCAVSDDFSRALGDPAEARFAAALGYIADGSCPSSFGVTSNLSADLDNGLDEPASANSPDANPAASIDPATTINDGRSRMPGNIRLR